MSNPNEPIQPENPEETLRSLERFKEEILKNREELTQSVENFDDLVNDETYQILRKVADVTEGDAELPPRKESPYKRIPSDTDEKTGKKIKKDSIDFSKIDDSPKISPNPIKRRNYAAERAMEILQRQRDDLEMLIGGKWSIIAGSLILFISLTTLIRWGIDNNHISPTQRVVMGMVMAIGLIAGAFKMNQNAGASAGMIIGGLGILYYTSHLSYSAYTFLSQQGAFFANILITAAAVYFVVRYERKVLGIFTLAGVYLTPFAVDLNYDNPVELYTYLVIANLVMLWIAHREKWYFINYIVFACAILPMLFWIFGRDMSPFLGQGLVFSSLIFATFFGLSIWYSTRKDYEFTNQDYLIFYLNTFFYFIFVYKIFRNSYLDYFGEFCLGLGAFNAIFAWALARNKEMDERLWRSLVGIPLFLMTFFAPKIFGTASLNFYWAAESVILIWLSQQGKKLDQLRGMSAIALFLAFCMMFYAWFETYVRGGAEVAFFFNSAVYTSFFMIVALSVSIALLVRDDQENSVLMLPVEMYANWLGACIVMIVWVIGNVELMYHHFYNLAHERLLINLFNTAFIFAAWFLAKILKASAIKNTISYFAWFMLGFYWIYGHFSAIELRDSYLLGNSPFYAFGTHYFNVGIILLMSYLYVRDTYLEHGQESNTFVWLVRYVSLIIVFHVSIELNNLVLIYSYDVGENINTLTDNSYGTWILMFWAMGSFALMVLGMRHKIKEMRVISLAIFVGILLKFFIDDFWELHFFVELLSLFILGAMMIGIGMMYKKLAILINEGEMPQNTPNPIETPDQQKEKEE